MKQETRSFYESIVRRAVGRVVQSLDEALDLAELARAAALSPLHFHHIFRGLVGETPLELHRRLRLERAAWRLSTSDARIASVAFDAGYETHESFTRAFREAYAASPSEFRACASGQGSGQPIELRARCGLHFGDPPETEVLLAVDCGEPSVDVEVEVLPEQRVAAVSHVGPYKTIFEAFRRLAAIGSAFGLFQQPRATLVTIYHDDPEATPQPELRSEAGIVVPPGIEIPKALSELRITAGRYARTTHLGRHTRLGDTWTRFMGEWLPHSGERAGKGLTHEVYRNSESNGRTDQLRTDLYIAIE